VAVYRYAGRRVGVSAAEQRADFGAGEDHCREGEVRAYGSAGGGLRAERLGVGFLRGLGVSVLVAATVVSSIFRVEYWICGIYT